MTADSGQPRSIGVISGPFYETYLPGRRAGLQLGGMGRHGFSRGAVVALLVGGLLVALALFALAARLVVSRPLFGSPAAAPVRLTGLPTPVVVRPQWTSYAYAGPIHDLALADGLLWAATDGGLVVWDGAGESARFNTEHGLPANRVSSVAIGPDGAIWAGTAGGLGRYDGRQWQTFTTDDGLPAGAVNDVAIGRDGLVWAATAAGLARYDGDGWRVFGRRGLLAALPSDNVVGLAVDSANRLWAATDAGLARLENDDWQTFTAADGLPGAALDGVAAGSDGSVWLSSGLALARTLDGRTFESFALALTGIIAEESALAGLAVAPDGAVYAAYNGRRATLLRFDPATNHTEMIAVEPPPADFARIEALFVDERGALWAGVGDTARRWADGRWTTLAAPSELPARELSDAAYSDGALWVASAGGVSRFDGAAWRTFGAADGLAGDARALAAAPDGALWVAFDSPLRGLSRYETGRWQTITCPTAAPISADILDAAQTPGAVWFATPAGVTRFDGAAWQTFDSRDGLTDDSVLALAAHGDTVWAATPRGVARYDSRWQTVADVAAGHLAVAPGGAVWAADDAAVYPLTDGGAPVELPLPAVVRDVAATDDAVWLATDNGALRYDGRWTVFAAAEGLPGQYVTAISVDAAGQVWAAAGGEAGETHIAVFDGQRWGPHPNRDAAAEQLTNNWVLGILAAPDGDVWLSTLNGLEQFHDGRWSLITEEQGLPSHLVQSMAWAYDTVWAGTAAGLARLDDGVWQPFGAAAPGQFAGPMVAALAVAPSGELWLATTPTLSRLHVYNGRTWSTVSLPSSMTVTQMAFTADGQLLAVVEEGTETLLGVHDGQAWAWRTSAELGLRPRWLGVAPDGRLWMSGLLLGRAPGDGASMVAVFEIAAGGPGREIGRFVAPDLVATSGGMTGLVQPIAFGPDGRVAVAGAESIYFFDSQSETVAPVETLELPVPFSRYTFAVTYAPDGRLWVGTEGGAAVWDGAVWQTYYAPPRAPEWWGSATTLLPRADGGILLGTSGGAVGLFTGRGFTGTLRPSEGPGEWAGEFYTVPALLSDDGGALWAASRGGGVARLTEAWEVFAPNPTLSATTNALAATGDRLWLATDGGWAAVEPVGDSCRFATVAAKSEVGAALADRSGGVWLAAGEDGVWRAGEGEPQQELSSMITSMALSPNGESWFAGPRQPWLLRYRPDGGADGWSRLPLDLTLVDPAALTSLAVASNLDLWLGGDGLVRFGGGQWSKLTTADGLADNDVGQVLVSPDGAVWAITAGGISRYEP